MKKFGYMGAVLLSSALVFSACSSDSDIVNGAGNTGNNESNGVVKTQFSINVPYGATSGVTSRMTEDVTQADGTTFNGIDNMRLFSFSADPTGVNVKSITNTSLGSTSDSYSSDKQRSLYRNISIPIGTSNFILYGRETRDFASTTPNAQAKSIYGYLKPSEAYTNAEVNISELNFTLDEIAPTANFSSGEATTVLNSLNKVLQSSAEYSLGTTTVTKKWSDLSGDDAEEIFLKDLYKKFATLTSGSVNSVKPVLRSLKEQIGEDNDDKPLSEEIVKNINAAIIDLANCTFPQNYNLPDGVAKLKLINNSGTSPRFVFEDASDFGTAANSIDYRKITYPASLAYFVNTDAMTSDKELTSVTELPNYDKWLVKDNEEAWKDVSFAKAPVTASTRSVGLREPLQYGVANLKLSVYCDDEGTGYLEDNAATVKGGETSNSKISLPKGGYPVTAVLVGGQPSVVGWNFEPTDEAVFDHTIYDNQMNGDEFVASTTSGDRYNYTLVLDNKDAAGTEANIVYVTIELTNNGAEFYGKNGLVPNNGTFYLVGALDLSKVKEADKNGMDHIFVQDHTTIARFRITNLKNAYNCIPDLRTAALSLGLAVDLSWDKGVDFGDITIGE